ncbi:phosphotriesterase family protein [Pararhodonellum marinum]|uniref:phosphotriesterase family protein n=1 Tax=Pararhodonellum marinum TaxID=2755358 RepID=UPI0021D1151B|nr:phosphotriesterase [Pararhodonellum marinum]
MGKTLIHEHILVNFIGAEEVGYHRWNRDSVMERVLPYLLELKAHGVNTIIECTPAYLGRDPELLQALSKRTGIQFLTNTGYYGAVDGKYLPVHVHMETAEQLASRWIFEFENGIEDTGIKPGFIKISVNAQDPLSEVDQKIVKAAGLTHLATGMVIASHTGPWMAAKQQLDILQSVGVSPDAFIWVHAQQEKNFDLYMEGAKRGCWISLDGVVWDVERHVERLVFAKENQILDHVLISHDAGWYSPGEPEGGDFIGFTAIFDTLIPILQKEGFSDQDFDDLLVKNPGLAFGLRAVKKGQ